MKKKIVFLSGIAIAVALVALLISKRSVQDRRESRTDAQIAAPAVSGQVAATKPASTGSAVPARSAAQTVSTNALSREFDPAINPYAGALREPGKSRRAWDPAFLNQFQNASTGDPIRFELTEGRMASGKIQIAQRRDGGLVYLSGNLTEPAQGTFFFIKPPEGGKAGKAVGVIQFAGGDTAYRIEPTGPNGNPELWQRRLDEVICQSMPLMSEAATNETANMPPLRPDEVAEYAPSYNSNVVSLQSYPGSRAVLLLDFFGGYTPTWGGISYPKPNVSNAQIKDLWKRVAEDYMPFNINVTTDIKVYEAAPASSRQRCVFTPSTRAVGSGSAGVAYVGSWNWGNDTVCWSIYTSGKSGAEVGAHEPGHTLGLSHQTQDLPDGSHNDYFTGQGDGATGWAPIMGAGYYQPVTTWAKGEYQYAGNHEDAIRLITTQNNNVTYRPDDTGSTLATSRYLEMNSDSRAWAEGVIERAGDTDAFQFSTTGGQVMLAANPVGDWSDLALMTTLADSSGTVLASNNPSTTLFAAINTYLPAGTYTFQVTGVGRNDPLTNGFSAYASLGYYSVAGAISGAVIPTRLEVMEHATNGTLVGTIVPDTNNTWACAITSGNTGAAFALDPGGLLSVTNDAVLDYDSLANNTQFPVQIQLFVDLTNLDNPALTKLNQRVVVAVRKAGVAYPLAFSGFNAGVLVSCDAQPAAPQATGFDVPNNYAFYQAGLNANPSTSAGGGEQGLPPSGEILSQLDNSRFQLGPYGRTNALLLGGGRPTSGTLTLAEPRAFNSLIVLASSANGGGLGNCIVHFTDGSSSPTFRLNAQDWYNTDTNVAISGFGRLKLGQGTFPTENAGSSNPNIYQTRINLAALGLNREVSSVTFYKPSGGSGETTAIFALSGDAMPPEVSIVQQPQSVTNSQPSIGATFTSVAMGKPSLGFQWFYRGADSSGAYAPLLDQTNANLTLTPPLTKSNAGNYLVVVTNDFSSATSSVATLTLFREPEIVQQPFPTNLVLFAGQATTFSVGVNAASPVYYTWRQDGNPVASGTTSFTRNNLQVANSGDYSVIVSNAFGSVTSSPVALTVLAAPDYPVGQRVLADHPIAWYRLDETNGTVAHDVIGGKNGRYNQVLLGQPGYNWLDTHTSGRFGASSPDNSLATDIPIDFAGSGNAAFTVEAWVKGGPQTTDCGIITKGTGAGGEQFNLDCGGGNHGYRFFIRDAGGSVHAASSSVMPNNQWQHLVGVCDEANSNIVLYVNGANVAQGTAPSDGGLLASSEPVTLGSRKSGANTAYDFQFKGWMEEVAIYNYALTPAQVTAHFVAASNRPPVFVVNPISGSAATADVVYSASIATNAVDPNGDAVLFSKVSGPAWLTIASNGALSGTPQDSDAGANTFMVRANDPAGSFSTANLSINVISGAPILAAVSLQDSGISLSWSGGTPPYEIQTSGSPTGTNWETLAGGLVTNSLILTPTNAAAFYRVVGQ